MIKIAETFRQRFLIAGNTYDNFLFEDCSYEFIEEAEKSLKQSKGEVKSCNIKIDKEIEKRLAVIFSKCETSLQESFFARDYINSLLMYQILDDNNEKQTILKEAVSTIENGDFERAKQYHAKTPLIYDIDVASKIKNRKLELNIFLIDTQNIAIQQAINNLLSARLPFSIKIFTTNTTLPCYYDQAGNLVQFPHDYMVVKVNNFVREEQESEME